MKTKIYLTAAAVATLALGSCSQDQVVEQSFDAQPKAIEFGVYTGKTAQTRGLETVSGESTADVSTGIKTTGFGITAFYTDETNWVGTSEPANFMWNQKVTWDKNITPNTWSYTPVKYWPTETTDKISFFAYAPYNSETTAANSAKLGIDLSDNTADGTPTVLFTVQDKAEDMVDFVADQVIDRQHESSTEQGDAGTVKFALQHELTRLTFDAKVSTDLINTKGTTIVNVKSVSLDGKKDGKFYKSATYKFGDKSTNRGSWSYNSATYMSDYSLESVLNPVTPASADLGGYVTPGVLLTFTETQTAKSLFKDNEYLFMIPVDANGGSGLSAEAASVTFTYDIVTVDQSLEKGHSVTSAKKTIWLPSGIMNQGQAYKITFLFEIDQIEVSAEVDGWGSVTGSDANIPYTPDDETANTTPAP